MNLDGMNLDGMGWEWEIWWLRNKDNRQKGGRRNGETVIDEKQREVAGNVTSGFKWGIYKDATDSQMLIMESFVGWKQGSVGILIIFGVILEFLNGTINFREDCQFTCQSV